MTVGDYLVLVFNSFSVWCFTLPLKITLPP
jgi:hypothetical protein